MCPELKEEEEEEEIHKAHRVLQWHHFTISKDDNAVTTNKTPAARTTITQVPKLFQNNGEKKEKVKKDKNKIRNETAKKKENENVKRDKNELQMK
jgi:hypothetical protein